MAGLAERFNKIRSKQINRAVENRAPESAEPEQDDFRKQFDRLLPIMTKFWNYSEEEVDHIKVEWTKPDVIVNAVNCWLGECEKFKIEIPDDHLKIASRRGSGKEIFLKKTIGTLLHNEEDGPWIAKIVSIISLEKKDAVLARYEEIYNDPSVPKESDRRRMANLSLIEAAEMENPELYKTVEQSSRKLV